MPRVLSRLPLFFVGAFCLLLACQPAAKRVILLVDGQRRIVETRAATVDEVLREEKITLGEDDRLDPPGYTPLERTATIQIVRVQIKTEQRQEPVEFTRQITRDEALPDGKMRVIQLGANGQAQVTFQVTLEDGKEVSRREISRAVLKAPRDEIIVLGTQNALAPVNVSGTLAYLTHGNAWVMRNSSDDKRPLTVEGDLDGRVFDLSPDGRYLLFTRSGSDTLNTLWLVDTVVLNEAPRRIPLENLLYAQWAPVGSNQIAYSTGEKTSGAPGWKAHNDLNIATISGISETMEITTTATSGITTTREITTFKTTTITVSANTPLTLTSRQIIPPSVPAPYAWWGGNLAWSADAQVFAYAFANQIGLIDVSTGLRRVVQPLPFYNTRADWVWTPQLAWSPDSRFMLASVHAPPEGAGQPEDSPVFDVWVFARDNSLRLALAHDAGMWAAPAWSPADAVGESKIAYGVALNSADTERSRYALYVMDRDGSNRVKIFPQGNENGLSLIQVAWSPDVSQLVAVREGDLWLYDFPRGVWSPLTANGDTRLPRWK